MRYSLLILSVLFAFASCDTKVEVPLSKEGKLREAKWKLDTAYVEYDWKYDGAEVMVARVDEFANYDVPGCRQDDLLEFRDNNDGAHIPGENICSINETAEVPFTWGISDDGASMFIYDAKEYFGFDVNAELTEFYDDKFSIKFYQTKDKAASINGDRMWLRDTTTYYMEFIRL